MWTAHRNSVILNGCVTSPNNPQTEVHFVNAACRPTKSNFVGIQVNLSRRSFVDWSSEKPVYTPLKCIKVEVVRDYNRHQLNKECEDSVENENANEESDEESGTIEATERCTVVSMPERGPPSWMWDNFCIANYNPKTSCLISQPSLHKTKSEEPDTHIYAKPSLPKCTVPQPFKMTLREENRHKQRRVRKAWEDTLNEPVLLPTFRAKPVPKSTMLPLYDKMVEECEKQRKVLREKRRELILAMQCSFNFGTKVKNKSSVSEKKAAPDGDRGSLTEVEKKFTFQPNITKKIPDFAQLHHLFEDRLKKVRKVMRSTIPQPFSFHFSACGDPTISTPKKNETCKNSSKAVGPVEKWNVDRIIASSKRLTKSALLRQEVVRKCLAQREENTRRVEKIRLKARLELQRGVSKWLNAQKQSSSTKAKEQQLNFRREMRMRSAEYKAELADIMDRVNCRPLLIQQYYCKANAQMHDTENFLFEQVEMDEYLKWSEAELKEQERGLGSQETCDSYCELCERELKDSEWSEMY